MSSIKENKVLSTNQKWLSWQFAIIFVALFAMVALILETPKGSIKGQIALGQKGFGLYSYNIRKNKVYAVASGPRYGRAISRGVWVNNDGTFEISQLPVGEYWLRVRAPGFESKYINSIIVEKDKATSTGNVIKMDVLSPYISIGSNMRVFTTEEAPHFWVNATGAVEATVKIYKKNILEELKDPEFKQAGVDCSSDLSLYPRYNAKFHNPYPEEKPFKQFKRNLKVSYSDSAKANFKLTKGMEPGDYIVIAEANDVTGKKRVSSISWFSVSDLGLIVKHAPHETLVRAINLKTLKPVENVDIELANQSGSYSRLNAVKTVKTDSSGIALMKFENGIRAENNLITGRFEKSTAYGGVSYWRGKEKQYHSYFYTDRPVYRLGQTVSYKLVSRELNDNGMVNPGANIPISVSIEDPTNAKMQTKSITTSRHGTANSTFDIPEDAKTGSYQIRFTYPTGRTSYQSFLVEQYRKPEYKVEVVPNSKRYIAGGKVKAKIKATYFFGAPVENAHVKYSVYESSDSSARYQLEPRPDYYSFFDDWYDASRYDNYSYGGEFISEGVARTNQFGEAEIVFDARPIKSERNRPYFYYDYGEKNVRIEADVTDISQLTVSSSGSALVTAGDFALFVEPKNYVVSVGDPLEAKIRAIGYDGKPVKHKDIDLKLSRWPWDRNTHSYLDEKILGEVKATTDDKGIANVSFHVGSQFPTDTFYITASAKDSKGNQIYYGNSVWVASDKSPYYLSGDDSAREPFKITLDKKVYKPGEVAKIMISGPFTGKEGIDALVTVEGTKIHKYQVKALSATANLVEIPILDSYTPNAYISVACAGKKKQFYNQSEMIKVSPKDHFLDISIESNKEKYKPGEVASYRISAKKKDGSPASDCELSLGVVDESIYSIRPEVTADIRKFFYEMRSNWVRTLCSFPQQYSGGPDKATPQLRKNFKDTAAWYPQLITDKNGEVVVKVKLPDNLTTWRATVRGISTNTDVGSNVQKILVTKDIIARLALPRFFTKGDRGQISAIVHNYSDVDQKIKLRLETASNFKTNIPLAKTLTIAKDKAEKFTWPVLVNKTGKSKIRLYAIGKTGSDALEREIKVNPLGLNVTQVLAGVLNQDNPTASLSQKLDPKAADLKSSLTLAGSTFAQLRGSYASLIDYPYGCTEQTMSRLVPAIVAYQMHKKFNVSLSSKQVEKFQKVRKKALSRLNDLQHYDGGWGWWSNDQSDPYLTAYVLEGMKLLKDNKIYDNPNMAKRGLTWLNRAAKLLHKQLTDPKLVETYSARYRRLDLARMVYVQTLYGVKPDAAVLSFLDKRVRIMPPESLTYLVMTHKTQGNNAKAQKAYDRLLELANNNKETVDWEHTKALLTKLKLADTYDYTYRYTSVETTALSLEAVLAMEPGNWQRIEKVKNWLMLHRKANGWSNTKTTAQVLLSLMDEAVKTGNENPSEILAILKSDDSVIDQAQFAPGDIFKKESTLKLPESLFAGHNVSLNYQGDGRLYYQLVNQYWKELTPNEKLNVPNSPSALKITRKFFKLETHAAKSDGTLQLRATPLTGVVEPGQIILMKVYLDTPISLPYVIIECPLPSGAEVVKSQGQENNLSGSDGGSLIEGDWGSPWWSHQDILDDKLVFFGNYVNQGKSEFHTLLRMELPAEVQINPVTLEGMYTEMIRGYSQPAALKVESRGDAH